MADLGKEFVELDRTLHAHVESGNTFAARDCQRLIPFTQSARTARGRIVTAGSATSAGVLHFPPLSMRRLVDHKGPPP